MRFVEGLCLVVRRLTCFVYFYSLSRPKFCQTDINPDRALLLVSETSWNLSNISEHGPASPRLVNVRWRVLSVSAVELELTTSQRWMQGDTASEHLHQPRLLTSRASDRIHVTWLPVNVFYAGVPMK